MEKSKKDISAQTRWNDLLFQNDRDFDYNADARRAEEIHFYVVASTYLEKAKFSLPTQKCEFHA